MNFLQRIRNIVSWRRIFWFVILQGFGCFLYWWILSAGYQERHVAYIEKLGGQVWYDYQLDSDRLEQKGSKKGRMSLLATWLGKDFVHTVEKIQFPENKKIVFDITVFPKLRFAENLSEDVENLQLKLTRLESISFSGYSSVTLFSLREHRRLKRIHLRTRTANDLSWLGCFPSLQELKVYIEDDSQLDYIVSKKALQKLEIEISSNCSLDFGKLKALPKLKEIKLSSHILPEIDVIQQHPNIESIELDFDQLGFVPTKTYSKVKTIKGSFLETSNLPGVEYFPNLEVLNTSQFLDQSSIKISRLTSLKELVLSPFVSLPKSWDKFEQLEKLKIVGQNKIDLQSLPKPNNLRTLEFEDCNEAVLPKLSTASRLEKLVFNRCSCVSGMPSHLPELKEVWLFNSDIDRYPGGKKLEYVNNFNSTCKDYSGLKNATNLIQFGPGDSNLKNIDFLENIKQLRSLRIHSNYITNLKSLQGITTLEHVNLENTKVSDLCPIRGGKNIRQLFVSNTSLTDLTQLMWFSELQKVRLRNLKNIDLAEIKDHPKLKYINLQDSEFKNFTTILDIKSLEELHVSAGTLTDADYALLEQRPKISTLLCCQRVSINPRIKSTIDRLLGFLGIQCTDDEIPRITPLKVKRLCKRLRLNYPSLSFRLYTK